jgi:hypothetical protein
VISESAAAPTAVRAAAPNDCPARADAVRADVVPAAAVLAAAVLAAVALAAVALAAVALAAVALADAVLAAAVAPMPQATAAANATPATSASWSQLAGRLIPASPFNC